MFDLEEQIVLYSRENIAKVDIFLKDPFVKRFIREEKISEFTFVGTVGGLLGLFLGFSFVSAVEIVYLCILGCITAKWPTEAKEEKVSFKSEDPLFIKRIYDSSDYPAPATYVIPDTKLLQSTTRNNTLTQIPLQDQST